MQHALLQPAQPREAVAPALEERLVEAARHRIAAVGRDATLRSGKRPVGPRAPTTPRAQRLRDQVLGQELGERRARCTACGASGARSRSPRSGPAARASACTTSDARDAAAATTHPDRRVEPAERREGRRPPRARPRPPRQLVRDRAESGTEHDARDQGRWPAQRERRAARHRAPASSRGDSCACAAARSAAARAARADEPHEARPASAPTSETTPTATQHDGTRRAARSRASASCMSAR